jgi:hypothetical protein
VPRLCEFYFGICLTTERKVRINLSQGKKNLSKVNKTSARVQYTYYQNTHPHTHTHTRTHTLITKPPHTHAHTLQNNIKPPQYKLKQTQYKLYLNEIVAIQSNTRNIKSPNESSKNSGIRLEVLLFGRTSLKFPSVQTCTRNIAKIHILQ